MYSLAIYIYMLCANVVSLFNKKARLMMRGHRETYKILRSNILENQQYIWFHAASLGEFEQGRPLIERIRKEFPQYKILLTFFSPSGYEVRKNYQGADVICYLPFDTALNARKFIKLAHPCMAFFIKYEFWQNYLTVLHKHAIPTYSVSSIFRENQIFFHKYASRYARVLKCFTHFFVQNTHSKELLAQHGIPNATVVGDTRFDRVIQVRNEAKPLPIVEAFSQKNPENILVAGSTWPLDEDILISYFNAHPNQRLVLAPHVVSEAHLQDIEKKLQRSSLRYTEADEESASKADCLIINCYGVLSSIYRYGKVAYVGGGFGVGIHNVPEAAVYSVPVVIGPNNQNFREAQALLQSGGCYEIKDLGEYTSVMERFENEPEFLAQAGKSAGSYIETNAGAVEQIFRAIDFSHAPASGNASSKA